MRHATHFCSTALYTKPSSKHGRHGPLLDTATSPGLHRSHPPLPGRGWYESEPCRLHSLHALSPERAKDPAGHPRHSLGGDAGTWPAGHLVHATDPSCDTSPTWQLTHVPFCSFSPTLQPLQEPRLKS